MSLTLQANKVTCKFEFTAPELKYLEDGESTIIANHSDRVLHIGVLNGRKETEVVLVVAEFFNQDQNAQFKKRLPEFIDAVYSGIDWKIVYAEDDKKGDS